MEELKTVNIFTDGACSGNPGPGGYGTILICDGKRKELAEGYRQTTNNRMELLAAIKGLEALKTKCNVTLYSDSKYLIDSIEKGWAKGWRKKNWIKADKSKAKNTDLWARLLDLLDEYPTKLVWVKGHAGHPENERCDELAVAATHGGNLKEDKQE